jgi:AcrR family transcriptional regulator
MAPRASHLSFEGPTPPLFDTDSAPASDGRVARGERTRQRLAEAMIGLLEEGDPQPTARRIAERAGVSLRLVFHHFEDLESILQAAVAIQEERHWSHIRPIPAELPLPARTAQLVRQRTEVFAAVAPVRRAAQQLEQRSPTVAQALVRLRNAARAQLRTTFAPELERLGGAERRQVLDALDVVTSWETWDQLQRLGRGPSAYRRTIEALVDGAIRGGPRWASPTSHGGET